MNKNWNQRVDLKRDNRLIGIKFVNVSKYNADLQIWEVMTGTIHMNRPAHHGQRPSDRIVSRFEIQMGHPYRNLTIGFFPSETRAKEVVQTISNPHFSQDGTTLIVSIDWIRERIADAWVEIMRHQGEPTDVEAVG